MKQGGEKQGKEIFAERLRGLMHERGMTQNQLANAVGMSSGSISKYLSGSIELKAVTLETFANYFDVSYDYLMGRSDCKKYTADMQAASGFTGLSDNSLIILNSMETEKRKILDLIIQNQALDKVLRNFSKYIENQEKCIRANIFREYAQKRINERSESSPNEKRIRMKLSTNIKTSANRTQVYEDTAAAVLFAITNAMTDVTKEVCTQLAEKNIDAKQFEQEIAKEIEWRNKKLTRNTNMDERGNV